jgi:predicted nucleotidyltransferase component of viral defense system
MKEDELRRIAGRSKIPLGIVEKDYVITLVLSEISRLEYIQKMIFRGGTCIKKIYFPNARFSIDVDFTCLGDVPERLMGDLNKKLRGNEIGNISFIDVIKEEEKKEGIRLSVRHHDMRGHRTSMKIDLSLRDDTINIPQSKEILNTYGLIPFKLGAMVVEELLAEKVRAVIARSVSRDLYDIWFLHKKGVPFHLDLVNEKLKLLKKDKPFNQNLFLQRLDEREESWERDLSMLLPEVPPYDQVKADIVKFISL